MRLAFKLLVIVLLSWTGKAYAGPQRVALVIGNSGYIHIPSLANPENDAQLVAKTLSELGFTLVGNAAKLDLTKSELDQVVQEFGRQAEGAEVALFYYAGHGVQVRGANYLVPIDANPVKESDVDFQMLDTNLILRQMESSGSNLNLLVLDACRNNPFGGRGLRSASSGLAQMQAPEGTLISFATQPGNVASDGVGGNSPFTAALAENIRRPGLDIFRVFNDIGLAVSKSTGGDQQPWVSSSPIKGDFRFVDVPANAAKKLDEPRTGELATLRKRMEQLESLLSADDRKSENIIASRDEKPEQKQARGHSYDGRWKVSVHSLSGCSSNDNTRYFMNVVDGLIDEPRHRRPKKGTITNDGSFNIKVMNKKGEVRARKEGQIEGNRGTGKLIGSIPTCTGAVEISKVN